MNLSIKIKWLLLLVSTVSVIITPEFAVWLIHTLFELLEGTLDEIVEHVFNTDRRTTQVIVFYLMLTTFLYLAYRIYRFLKIRTYDLMETLPYWCKHKKEQAKTHWQKQTFIKKIKLISGCFLGAIGLSYLVFS